MDPHFVLISLTLQPTVATAALGRFLPRDNVLQSGKSNPSTLATKR